MSDALPKIDSYEALKAQLDQEGLPYREAEDVENTISLPTRLGEEDGILHIRWEPTPGVVQFAQALPIIVPEESRPAVGNLLHRINHRLAVTGFTFNEERGTIAFRTQSFLGAEGFMAPGLIGALVATCARTAAQYMGEIRDAMGSGDGLGDLGDGLGDLS
ncbi:MAG: YbjN domain-containing protein [Candidatus Competibacterales bacterium]